jgi:microcystin-dependent protein
MHLAFWIALQLTQPCTSPGSALVAPGSPEPLLVSFCDVTGDGLPDRVSLDDEGRLGISVNRGNRVFDGVCNDVPPVFALSALIEDLDDDGLPDLFFVTEGPSIAFRNVGQGRFEPARDALGLADPGPGASIECADLDGDGRRDVLLHDVDADVVFWRDGAGSFTRERMGTPGSLSVRSTSSTGVASTPLLTNPRTRAVPAGTILAYGGATAPPGFLLCDGAEVDRGTFARLFGALGTAYGNGDGTTTFDLPDLRQRFALGQAVSGTGSTLGATGGSIDHTHTSAAHTHDLSNHTHLAPAHSHAMGHVHFVPGHFHDTHGPGATIEIAGDGAEQHAHHIGARMNSAPGHSNRFMEADLSTGQAEHIDAGSGSTPGAAGEHDHDHTSFTGTVGNASSLTNGDSGFSSGSSSISSTGTAGGAQTGGPSVNATGSTTPADTGAANPPYVVVNYIIKT